MANELRSYRHPKAKKSFLAISQAYAPLSPDAAKARGQRNYYTNPVLDLEVPQVSTLKRLRSVLYNEETTKEVIIEKYSDWVSKNQYLIFEQKRQRSPIRQIASLVPKRGNPKYAWKVRKRWREFTFPFEYQQKLESEKVNFAKINETTTNVLFLSLTWDVNFCDWKTAGTPLATSGTYSWLISDANCILYFPDCQFPTFLKWSNKKNRHIWRIPFPEVAKLRGLWHSFIDVQGMVNLADGMKYLGKYLTKGTDLESGDLSGKGLITLANTWAFRKRAYSLGAKFKEAIFEKYISLDLTRISVTQTVSEQMTLENKLLRDSQLSFIKPFFEKWVMRGIMEKEMLKKHGGIPKGCFSFGLCDTQKAFASWFFDGIRDSCR